MLKKVVKFFRKTWKIVCWQKFCISCFITIKDTSKQLLEFLVVWKTCDFFLNFYDSLLLQINNFNFIFEAHLLPSTPLRFSRLFYPKHFPYENFKQQLTTFLIFNVEACWITHLFSFKKKKKLWMKLIILWWKLNKENDRKIGDFYLLKVQKFNKQYFHKKNKSLQKIYFFNLLDSLKMKILNLNALLWYRKWRNLK